MSCSLSAFSGVVICQLSWWFTSRPGLPDLGKLSSVLYWTLLVYFIAILSILRPFGIILYGNFPPLGMFVPKKIWQP
jgi:hypothetical protein